MAAPVPEIMNGIVPAVQKGAYELQADMEQLIHGMPFQYSAEGSIRTSGRYGAADPWDAFALSCSIEHASEGIPHTAWVKGPYVQQELHFGNAGSHHMLKTGCSNAV
jgi:hypothetical protein